MKKLLIFLVFATAMNASVAKSYPPPPLLDDSDSFRIAKSVKLGYGENTRHSNKGVRTSDFKTCSSDDQCPATQTCVDGTCKNLCSPNPCPEQKPNCEAKDHSYTCSCTEKSCGAGKECVNGKCESCDVGSKCNCDGEKVLGTDGTCVCPTGLSCSAGQYVSGDCSCKKCQKDDTRDNKCGCPGNTVPDGNGSCYCKETKTCNPGYTFDDSNTCECVVCTGGDCNCPEGTVPTADGCKAYACAVDDDCAEGNRCENGKTENAQCVPCGKNEQCRCPEGQLSDGTGKCVPVECKTGLVCSKDITEQCCDAGMQCVNPDTVESYCAACEVNTQCTCPKGYLVNQEGTCVKPACTKNSDCPNGKYCENAGKVNAECVPCAEGETCTCTGGMIADGKGGCKFGCEFSTAAACKSGTANCSNCVLTGGCYICSSCNTGFELSGSTCEPKVCSDGYSPKTTGATCDAKGEGWKLDTKGQSGPFPCGKCVEKDCPAGYQTGLDARHCGLENKLVTKGMSGDKVCGKCEPKDCPEGTSTDITKPTCIAKGKGWKYESRGMSGQKFCGICVEKDCPTGYSTSPTMCMYGFTEDSKGMSGDKVCVGCIPAECPADYSTDVTKATCDAKGEGWKLDTKGQSGLALCGKCVKKDCPIGYKTGLLMCSYGTTLDNNGMSGDEMCWKCIDSGCEKGYSTDTTSCSVGYTLKTSGKSGNLPCNKCEPASCPSGYSTTTTVSTCTKMGVGWGHESKGMSGDSPCGKCFEKACPTNYSTDVIKATCDAKGKGWQYLQYGKSGNSPCGRCGEKECPSGYSTNPSCTSGKKVANSSNYSGNSVCKHCVNCNAGEQCGCPAGQVADGNGGCKAACKYSTEAACKSGISHCGSCSKDSKGCYNCSACNEGYTLSLNMCVIKDCPSGFSITDTEEACKQKGSGYTFLANGKSGDKVCGQCMKKFDLGPVSPGGEVSKNPCRDRGDGNTYYCAKKSTGITACCKGWAECDDAEHFGCAVLSRDTNTPQTGVTNGTAPIW